MSTYTNIGLENPVPLDPSTSSVWGAAENTGRSLIDAQTQQTLTKSVAGGANVSLSFTLGTADETKHAHFIFTGVLTANINVLWPNLRSFAFSVLNNTTGSYTLSCGADNGSGAPAGTTVAVSQGSVASLVSDGTNVSARSAAVSSAMQPVISASTLAAARTAMDVPSIEAMHAITFGLAN